MIAKPSKSPSKQSGALSQPLPEWIAQHLAPSAQVQMRLRGNILHVLCETPTPLHRAGALTRLVEALLHEPAGLETLLRTYPQVYQLYLYSRQTGQRPPDWTAPLYLNRLERHQAQLQQQANASLQIAATQVAAEPSSPSQTQSTVAATWQQDEATTALVLSHLSAAQRGDPEAIAWYLSEVLSTLDVGVWVSVRAVRGNVARSPGAVSAGGQGAEAVSTDPIPRLWIFCEAAYSPDPLLIAEPVTERLRQLELTQFKDAVLVVQINGEEVPDWSLRIDLTPAQEMLRDWGRWGDEGAIARLVNQAIATHGVRATVERKDESLHFIVQPQVAEATTVPPAAPILDAIAPLLETLAPQGLHRAMIYGQIAGAETPAWVRCLNLPGLEHAALADDPRVLAQQGDLPALAYLLTRLLNPDLDAQLATGGIRVQVLRRNQLLHVMADAPICPTRRQVGAPVIDFLKMLEFQDINGVRLYGRRAGQQRPTWSYGSNFQERPRIVPENEPTFAVSDAYVGDLLMSPAEDALRADLTAGAVGSAVEGWWQRSLEGVRQLLIRTQLVVPQSELPRTPPPIAARDRRDAFKISVVWGLVGVLLALQADWLLGQVLHPTAQSGAADAADAQSGETAAAPPDDFSELSWEQNEWDRESEVFGGDGFTAGDAPPTAGERLNGDLRASPDRSLVPTSDLLATSPYASFKSEQMDEKLALYHQRLQESGPPDILIIGSSRALRGVDPAALRQELASLGFGDLDVFNFGVNGSTAQVVDLTLRRILEADELPRLILWADGARAFNSGRTDVTYNGIATSEGYRELDRRNPEPSNAGDDAPPAEDATVTTPQSIAASLRDSYQALDQTLSDQLGQWSALHRDREQLKDFVRDRVLLPLTSPIAASVELGTPDQKTSDLPIPEGSRIDFDGFLALDVRFNPATYYQLYARVPGAYDSDYEAFELRGVQFNAFQRLLGYTQEQGIPVVFVNTPLTDEYLDSYRMAAEADFLERMLQLSATEDLFIFRDLGQVWADRYDYFSDPSHLNRFGAYQVSNRIAQDPMIPWPRAEEPVLPDPETTP